jgi:hypothetical protein
MTEEFREHLDNPDSLIFSVILLAIAIFGLVRQRTLPWWLMTLAGTLSLAAAVIQGALASSWITLERSLPFITAMVDLSLVGNVLIFVSLFLLAMRRRSVTSSSNQSLQPTAGRREA